MASLNNFIKEDVLWLKWNLVVLGLALTFSLGLYVSAFVFRNDVRRQEIGIRTNTEVLSIQLREIAESERIIIENIDTFNSIVQDGVMDEENRVTLLEDISRIRERHHLFPIDIEIAEQERKLLSYDESVEFPDEQITLRSSRMTLNIPLLHEEDLSRFFVDFLRTRRLLVANRCVVNNSLLDEDAILDVVDHQRASCEFYWFTLRREPFTGI